jgi:hypothetical protein
MIIDFFKPPKGDLLHHSHNDFWSYLEEFDTYPFEHLYFPYKENFQPLMCTNFDKGEDTTSLKKDSFDEAFHPPFPLSCYVTKDVFWEACSLSQEVSGEIFSLRI